MAQNVTIAGASYSDVPSIVVPKTGGGTASFTDVSSTTAVAEDVANGKIFYLADGTQGVGTSSGGGTDYLEIFIDFLSGTANADPLSLPGLQKIDGRNKCTNIKFPSIVFPDLTSSLPDFCFQGAIVPILVFPSLTGRIGTNAFRSTGSGITTIDFGPGATETGGYTFNGCSALSTIIFRRNGVVRLANTGNTVPGPFASSGAGGTLYVPSAQIASYQAANNWSTILGYPNNQIKSIESTHTDPNAPIDLTLYYADGTPIT